MPQATDACSCGNGRAFQDCHGAWNTWGRDLGTSSASAQATQDDAIGTAEEVPWAYIPDAASSFVFHATFDREMHRKVGAESYEIERLFIPLPGTQGGGISWLAWATANADLPIVRYLLRNGVDMERRQPGAPGPNPPMVTSVSRLVFMLVEEKVRNEDVSNSDYARLLRFLLDVGASPNPEISGGIAGNWLWCSPLLFTTAAAMLRSTVGSEQYEAAVSMADSLLRHGAHLSTHDGPRRQTAFQGTVVDWMRQGGRSDKTDALEALVKKYAEQPRPPRRCPCGNGKLFLRCHAGKEDLKAAGVDASNGGGKGAELQDGDYCPCSQPRNGKLYGRCCKRAGKEWRETLKEIVEIKSFTAIPDLLSKIQEMQQEAQKIRLADPSMAQEVGPQLGDIIGLGMHEAMLASDAAFLMLPEAIEAGVDPAFVYAIRRAPFKFRGHFPIGAISAGEQLRRKGEWNHLVDEYIAAGKDCRSARQGRCIEVAAKIAANGGPLFRQCDNISGRCEKVEPEEGAFKRCAACRGVAYCSTACQKTAWVHGGHKKSCGQARPSESPGVVYLKASTIAMMTHFHDGLQAGKYNSFRDPSAVPRKGVDNTNTHEATMRLISKHMYTPWLLRFRAMEKREPPSPSPSHPSPFPPPSPPPLSPISTPPSDVELRNRCVCQ